MCIGIQTGFIYASINLISVQFLTMSLALGYNLPILSLFKQILIFSYLKIEQEEQICQEETVCVNILFE